MPLNAIMLGAGNRGFDVYGNYALAHPEQLKFVAVADADPAKLKRFGDAHNIALEFRFSSWEDAIQHGRASTAFICLPDSLHETAAIKALQAGFHLMLEKPVASTLEGTLRVAKAARDSERVVMLGYVLRYTPFFQTIRQIVQSGQLGEVVTVSWRENVSSLHMAHSFVRGNWGNSGRSSAMILAKCSHDLDLLGWLTGKQISSLSSFGNLQYFNLEHAPEGSPERCLDGCPAEDCIYHAAKIYLTDNTEWPTSTISADTSLEARRRILETTNYGRCVYRMDNDVVDNQVVAFNFESGGSGTLTMHGLSAQEGRTIRIDGTKASLRAVFNDGFYEIKLEPHGFGGRGEVIPILESETAGGRHGGGDGGLTAAFIQAVQNDEREPISSYLTSHILAFAIEQARLEGSVIDLTEFKSKLEFS